MTKWFKRIIFTFCIFILIKIIISCFIAAPSAFSDEYSYIKMAQSFFEEGTLKINEIFSHTHPPLYPITISPAFIFENNRSSYFFIKIINAVISSLIIFPMFYLSKKVVSEKDAFALSTLVVIMPFSFGFSPLVLSENLFYPLFMFACLFLYNSITKPDLKMDILAGLFIGLSILTKTQGIILVPTVMCFMIYNLIKKSYRLAYRKGAVLLITAITLLPWVLRNGIIFGFNIQGILGGYSYETGFTANSIHLLLFWAAIYFSYLIVAAWITFPAMAFNPIIKKNNKKILALLTLFLTVFAIFMSAKHSVSLYSLLGRSRIVGRYIEILIPFVLLVGYQNWQVIWTKRHKILCALFLIMGLIGIYIMRKDLMPINNMSLSWAGAIFAFGNIYPLFGYLKYILIGIVLIGGILYLVRNKISNPHRIICSLIIISVILSGLNIAMAGYNAHTGWYKSDMMQLGLWFNDLNDKRLIVLFDKENECTISKTEQCLYEQFPDGQFSSVPGIWMNAKIIITEIPVEKAADFIVTTKELNLKKVKSIGQFNIYEARTI